MTFSSVIASLATLSPVVVSSVVPSTSGAPVVVSEIIVVTAFPSISEPQNLRTLCDGFFCDKSLSNCIFGDIISWDCIFCYFIFCENILCDILFGGSVPTFSSKSFFSWCLSISYFSNIVISDNLLSDSPSVTLPLVTILSVTVTSVTQ